MRHLVIITGRPVIRSISAVINCSHIPWFDGLINRKVWFRSFGQFLLFVLVGVFAISGQVLAGCVYFRQTGANLKGGLYTFRCSLSMTCAYVPPCGYVQIHDAAGLKSRRSKMISGINFIIISFNFFHGNCSLKAECHYWTAIFSWKLFSKSHYWI